MKKFGRFYGGRFDNTSLEFGALFGFWHKCLTAGIGNKERG